MNILTQELRIVFIASDGKKFFDKSKAESHQQEVNDTIETEEEFRISMNKHRLGEL